MRIALVANAYPPFFVGGAEIAAHRQAIELVARGHTLSCFCAVSDARRRPYSVAYDTVDGVEVTRINTPGHRFKPRDNFINVAAEAAFSEFLDREAPEVVHFHNLPGLSLGLFDVAEAHGVPAIATFHDHWGFCLQNTLIRADETRICPDWRDCEVCLPQAQMRGLALPTFMRTAFVRSKLHKAALFHFPSRYLRDAYVEAGFDGERAHLHTYGIQSEWFAGDLVSQPLVDRALRIVFVAYLGRHKGPDTLFEALSTLERQGHLDRVEVDIHGRGDMELELTAAVAANGWGNRVRLHGRTDNAAMRRVYENADVMVNCSRWPENEPLTLLESLACGVPVIATAMGGNVELVEDGVNGWLYPAGDAEALASRLLSILQERDRVDDKRVLARSSVAQRTIARYADFAERAYGGLSLPCAADLPSIVAVFYGDLEGLDAIDLREASRTGFWAEAEWLPAEAMRGGAEFGAVVAGISLDGRLGDAANLLNPATPMVVLGTPRDPRFTRFHTVTAVEDVARLADLGLRLSMRASMESAVA